jgi:filamentous hemagglutinin
MFGLNGEMNDANAADTARGSSVNAGGSIAIQATGAGRDSNLTVQGSSIKAAGTTRLQADNQVNLLAAQNTTQESSTTQSKSGSVGVAIQLGAGGGGMGFTASASKATGQGAGNGVTYTNTQVAGNTVSIQSGGDTTLMGAVVKGEQVSAKVGGNLNIESLQDQNQYKESSKSAGASVMVGAGVSGSVNLAKSSINNYYQNVGEQSAIRAGDGGFAVNVSGKTDLVGAQITSTQAAIDNNKNNFQAKEGTTVTDLQNTAAYSANSASVGLSTSGAGNVPGKSASAGMSGVGLGSDKGSASSTTTAGISGVAGNAAARTGDKETGIAPIFDADKVKKDIEAQVTITSEFGKQASKAVGDYAATQLKKAQDDKDPAAIAAWSEGGANRVALHTLVGGLTGGAAGAVGAGAASAAAPSIDDLQGKLQDGLKSTGLGDSAAKVIASLASGATAAGIGAVASGGSTAGAATAFNADMNNRQIGVEERRQAAALANSAKASGLVKPDGTAYTAADIETAMRNSNKSNQSITQGMLVDSNDSKAITDKGAAFTVGGDGKTLVQVNPNGSNLNPNKIDPKLAAYIVEQTGGANTPYKDLYNQVTSANKGQVVDPNAGLNKLTPAGNGCVTAECAASLLPIRNPIKEGKDIRQDAANTAALVGRGAGIVSNAATAAAAVPGPHQPAAAGIAVTATGVDFVSKVVEQFASPDKGKLLIESAVDIATKPIADKFPMLSPVLNEAAEILKNIDYAKDAKEKVGK